MTAPARAAALTYYTRAEAAAALRTSLAKIDAAIHGNRLRAKTIGRDVRISEKDLARFFESLPDA